MNRAAPHPTPRLNGGDPAGRQEEAVWGSSTGGQPGYWWETGNRQARQLRLTPVLTVPSSQWPAPLGKWPLVIA
jgi:hypothetical protein